MKYEKLRCGNAEARVGASIVIREFNLVDTGTELLDDRTDLASHKSVLRKILKQCYHREWSNRIHNKCLKHKATGQAGNAFTASNDPATANEGLSIRPIHFEVYHVPLSVSVGKS
jgi:hypothetical protein